MRHATHPRASAIGSAALVALLSMLGAPSTARAYEDQATLDLDLGYAAALATDALPPNGVQFGVGGSWGLNDAWTIRGRLAYGVHPAAQPLHVGILGVEVVYLLDLVEVVPFAGLGADALGTGFDDGTGGGSGFEANFAIHAVLGLDWLVSRRFIVGLDVRPYILPLAFDAETLAPVYLSASVRLSFVFERY